MTIPPNFPLPPSPKPDFWQTAGGRMPTNPANRLGLPTALPPKVKTTDSVPKTPSPTPSSGPRGTIAGGLAGMVAPAVLGFAARKVASHVSEATTGNIRQLGGSLIASLRDAVISAQQGPVNYNQHLNIFCAACGKAAKLRFKSRQRKALEAISKEARSICGKVDRHLSDMTNTSAVGLLQEITELEAAIGQL